MKRTLSPTESPRYRSFSDPKGPDQPLGFFLLESLLMARSGSSFPTNGAGPDEAVNVYLAHLLGSFLRGEHDPRLQFASGALFNPPPAGTSRRERAAYYRINADHRLLSLGLFARGDLLRRRNRLYGLSVTETRRRDLAAGQACYEVAANLLRGRIGADPAHVAVLDLLAAHFADYVHVLGALATRHLGLGACLDDTDLARLLPPDPTADAAAVADLLAAPPPPAALDDLLDLWLENRRNPDPAVTARVRDMAARLGVELEGDESAAPGSTVAEPHDFPDENPLAVLGQDRVAPRGKDLEA